jgi:hypothetical protein
MVMNRLQNGLQNSRKDSRLNCKKKFSNANTYFFLVILIEIFILKTTMYDMIVLPQIRKH